MIEKCIKKEINSDLKADLYYIIQSIIKNQNIPLKFLIRNFNSNNQNLNSNCQKLISEMIQYIETNINSKLTDDQKNILLSFILYITRNEA